MSKYTLLSAISLLFLISLQPAIAQSPNNPQVQERGQEIAKSLGLTKTTPTFQGLYVSADIFGIGGKIFGSDFFSTEVAVEANFKNRFYPILEVGFGTTDTTDEDNDMHYKTSAPYFRIGANYNIQYKKQRPDHIYVGARLAYSNFKYDIDGPALEDPVWGGSIPFEYTDVKSNALWGELLIGVKARVYKSVQMGWDFRYKVRLNVKENENSSPWYIPGFGANSSTKFGATYRLIYYIPKKN